MPLEDTSNNFLMTVESPVSKPPSVEHRKVEPLSDEELGNLLAALGNNEAKTLTLALMKPGVIYTQGDLHRMIIDAQGSNVGWKIGVSSPFAYCVQSFDEPIGLVAKGVNDAGLRKSWGYIKTDYGENTGTALAGLLLDFSLRHPDLSLYEVFGSTASRAPKKSDIHLNEGSVEFKKRSPIGRLKIIWELATAKKAVREKDLIKAVGENQSADVDQHLFALEEAGLVSLEHKVPEIPNVLYKFTGKMSDVDMAQSIYPVLTRKVKEIMEGFPDKEWTIAELMAEVRANNESSRKYASDSSFYSQVNTALAELVRLNSVSKAHEFEGYQETNIFLNQEQQEILVDLLTIIYQFQNQDHEAVRQGWQMAKNFSSNEVSTLMAKAKNVSPQANKISSVTTKGEIMSYLQANQNVSVADMREYLKKNGKVLTRGAVGHFLNVLAVNGLVTSELVMGEGKWNVTSKSNPAIVDKTDS